jgi:hypothetical protein
MSKKLASNSILIILIALVNGALSIYWDPRWNVFKREHSKQYPSLDEEIARYRLWRENTDLVESHNNCNENFKLRMNEYGDMSFDEFVQKRTGLVRSREKKWTGAHNKLKSFTYKEIGCTPRTFGIY